VRPDSKTARRNLVCARDPHPTVCGNPGLTQTEHRLVDQRLSIGRAFDGRYPRVDGLFAHMQHRDVGSNRARNFGRKH
jgi:hypothetical protein